MLELFLTVLRSAGAHVFGAETAEQAVRLASSVAPDVAVIDIILPDRDGYWVLGELNALPGPKHPIAIAVTAGRPQGHEVRARAAGFAAFFTKPIEPGDFIDSIAWLVERGV